MADTARIEELRRRVQTDPASIAFAALAEEYRRAGKFDDAIATCRTGLQRHPAYLSARVTLGRSLLEVGHFDEARHELEQVLRAAPENLAAIRALAEIHHRVGELPESGHEFPATEAPVIEPPAPVASPIPPQAAVPAAPQPVTPVATQPATTVAPQLAAPVAPPAAPLPAALVASPVLRPTPAPLAAASLVAAAPPPAPAARLPHPDEVALPALEAFLSAIVAARDSGNRVSL
jgi:tetratricopeptide (TPR) repeat protein